MTSLTTFVRSVQLKDMAPTRISYRKRNEVSVYKKKLDAIEKFRREYNKDFRINDTLYQEMLDNISSVEQLAKDMREEAKYFDDLLNNRHFFRRQLRKSIIRLIRESKAKINGRDFEVPLPAVTLKHNGQKTKLGPFIVTIKTGGYVPIIKNTANTKEGYHHPHVNRMGNPCLGNFKNILSTRYYNGQWYEYMLTLYAFLSIYNHNSPHLDISHWMENVDYCNNCGRLNRHCDCNVEDEVEDEYYEDDYDEYDDYDDDEDEEWEEDPFFSETQTY